MTKDRRWEDGWDRGRKMVSWETWEVWRVLLCTMGHLEDVLDAVGFVWLRKSYFWSCQGTYQDMTISGPSRPEDCPRQSRFQHGRKLKTARIARNAISNSPVDAENETGPGNAPTMCVCFEV